MTVLKVFLLCPWKYFVIKELSLLSLNWINYPYLAKKIWVCVFSVESYYKCVIQMFPFVLINTNKYKFKAVGFLLNWHQHHKKWNKSGRRLYGTYKEGGHEHLAFSKQELNSMALFFSRAHHFNISASKRHNKQTVFKARVMKCICMY